MLRLNTSLFYKAYVIFAIIIMSMGQTSSQTSAVTVMALRDRAVWVDSMLEKRFDKILPAVMKSEGINMWILISREYNEDPVLKTMLPSSWLSARRRTILVSYQPDNGGALEKLAIARYDVGTLLKGSWNLEVFPDQWEALNDVIQRYKPRKIGLNTSPHFGLADGLVNTDYQLFLKSIPSSYRKKIVSAEKLCLRWLETRSDMELEIYQSICRLSRDIIMSAFDSKYITAGKTTTDDIVWRLRQITTDLGLESWFHPTVSIQRADPTAFDHLRSFSKRPSGEIIEYGDLLHVDFGISYLRLHTDQQQHFYVLKPGEENVPASLAKAFQKANLLQDILTDQFSTGITGNDILKNTLSRAREENILCAVYSHPIGFHGHAAGPTIGLWDQQGGVPGSGDYVVYPNTAYSIELNAASEIPEWGKVIRIMLEEDGYFDGQMFHYFSGRQQDIYPLRVMP